MNLGLWQRLRDEVLAFGTVCIESEKKKEEKWEGLTAVKF